MNAIIFCVVFSGIIILLCVSMVCNTWRDVEHIRRGHFD